MAKHGGSWLGLAEGGGLLAALHQRSPTFLFWGLQAGGVLQVSVLPRSRVGCSVPQDPSRSPPGGLPAAGALEAMHEARGHEVPPAQVATGASTWWVT